MHGFSLAAALCLCVATVGMTGCGSSELDLQDVSGTATFAGKPIVYGQIEFVPDAARSHEGPAGSAEITEGRFDTADGGTGILWGAYKVRVTAYDQKPTSTETDENISVQGVPPLCVAYPFEMEIHSAEITIDVPATAKGFDLFRAEN